MKRLLSIVSVLLIMTMLCVCVFANGPQYVCDMSGILGGDEGAQLESKLSSLSESYDMDFVVVTTDTLDGKSTMEYADDFYDEHGYRESGILLLVSFENREIWISTAGDGIYIFTDAGIDAMLDNIVPYFSDGDWYGGFNEYAALCEDYYIHARDDAPYDVDDMPKEKNGFDMINVIAPVGIGIAAGFIATGVMKSKLKSVHFEKQANNYIKGGSFELTQQRDIFLYSTITKTPKPQNNNNGHSGGSSVHMSGGGISHGGGGRGF